LIGPAAGTTAVPAEGYRLLILLPGGDGSAEFHWFAQRIAKYALLSGYMRAPARRFPPPIPDLIPGSLA